jgi:RNA polymerase sigma-70 factor (ECF subfamily)
MHVKFAPRLSCAFKTGIKVDPYHISLYNHDVNFSLLDDGTLLNLIAHAQEEALSELYDRYSSLVYSVAMNSLADQALAEEITQDVFVRVWERAGTYRNEQGKVATWLASIARNRAIDVYRHNQARRGNLNISWETTESFDPPATQNVEAEVDLAQRVKHVRWAVSQLPEDQRLALGLAFFQGLTHPEIALMLGEPLGTVKTRIRLAMLKLRDLIQVDGLDRNL